MTTGRLEAFSDGVLAIIITVMVLELKLPPGHDLRSLIHTTGIGLLTYLLSFVYVGIYWNNHHHMFHLVRRIRGARTPVVVYGLNLLSAGIAYVVLQTVIIRQQGPDSPLRQAVGTDRKGKLSSVFYLAGILSALLVDPGGHIGVSIALAFFVATAIMWIVPDRRIARVVTEHENID